MNYRRITKCRICGNRNLYKIGSLGKIAVSNFTKRPSEGVKMPLELLFCRKCTLLQLAHDFNRNLLYKDYWYVSALNPVIVKDLEGIVAKGIDCSPDYPEWVPTWIDIGANDGTLLNMLSPLWYRIGVDPAKNLKPKETDPYIKWYDTYWENVRFGKGVAHVITAIACLYDLPSPNLFIKNVKRHLAPSGVFISQFQPLSEMVELNDVGNICHEHLEYYSYKSLVYLFQKNGLEIFKVEKNKMNGGSYRLFARHFKKGSVKFKEKEYGIKELREFFRRIEENMRNLNKFVLKGADVYGYGASTKANTILQYYGMSSWGIKAIIDINPSKKDKFTIATKIPIIDYIPEDAEYLWVFPYGFLDYFRKKEKKYKGKWVTTIPEFKIV